MNEDDTPEWRKRFGSNCGKVRKDGAHACHLCSANANERCQHITQEQFLFTTSGLPAGRTNSPGLLDLLDGLKERDLLDRVQIVTCEGASVQLAPKPFVPPALTEEQEAAREGAKVEPVDPQTLLLAASEGFA